MRSDLIIDLVKAGVEGNSDDVRVKAEAIAADQRAKRHDGVADRITHALLTSKSNSKKASASPGIRVRDGSGGVLRSNPERSIDQVYLNEVTRTACDELIEEHRRADLLRAFGMEPRHRILLSGPPGNGKTSLAEAIAFELALPLFTVRYETIVTSYLGETAQRLKRLFDYVRTQPCVLFFDEFDALGKERGDIHETGEIKRVVTTLLLLLDDLPPYCVLVGATNHPELLDKATWRRFQLRLNLGRPSNQHFEKYFSDNLAELEGKPGYTAKRLLKAVAPNNFSEAEEFFLDVKRRTILSQGTRDLRNILDDRVKAFKSWRFSILTGDKDDRPANIEVSDTNPLE